MLDNLSSEDMALKRTSVSIFLPSLAGGGAERAMLHLAEGLVNHGLKVDLVLSKAEGEYLAQVANGVRVIDLKSKYPKIFGILFSTLALKRYLQQEQPRFLLATLDIFGTSTWAQRLASVPTKVVLCVQNNLSKRFQGGRSLILKKVKFDLVRHFYPWADGIVAVSEGVAKDLTQIANLLSPNIRVIHNPVVKPNLFEKAKESIEHPWLASQKVPVMLGAGRLTKQKDFPTLIRAFAKVRTQFDSRLIIIGEGEERPRLETLVRQLGLTEDVSLPGFVDNPYKYMARSALFVMSSSWEGFGNVLVEAMAVGTPVVSTDCPSGPAEILEYGKYGKLVPVGDSNALADAIAAVLSNPPDPGILQQRSQEFSVERIVDQYLELILTHTEFSTN